MTDEPKPITDEQLAELATALRARADWLDLPRNVEAPRPYISREQFRDAASLIAEVKRLRAVVADRAAVVEECARRVEAPAVAELVEALEWYGENARLCRLIHSEGDAGRHALSEDGGKRARALLAKHASPRDAT